MSYLLTHAKLLRKCTLLFIPFPWISTIFAQTAPTYDELYQAVIARHGGQALALKNTQVSGLISYRGETTSSFLLTLQGNSSRLERSHNKFLKELQRKQTFVTISDYFFL